jgi:hypothetical protein
MAAGAGRVYVGYMSPRLLALLVAGAALTAGCGQAAAKSPSAPKPKPTSTDALIARSAAATQDAGTARVAFSVAMSGMGQAGDIDMTGDGTIAFAKRRADMSFHVTAPQAGVTLDMSERMIGTVLYMRSPFLTAGVGTPWVKLDLQQAGKREGFDFNALMSSGNTDPTEMLSYLQAASQSIHRVGQDSVRGVEATHYHVVLDFLKIASGAPSAQRAAIRRTIAKEVRLLGRHTMPVDVWIDRSGLVRREQLSLAVPVPGQAGLSMKMRMDLFDFGVPVHVVEPPAGDVTDVTGMVAP